MLKENVKLSSAAPHFSCATCCAWVSESKAITRNGEKGHFCGAECLDEWYAKQREDEEEKKIGTE